MSTERATRSRPAPGEDENKHLSLLEDWKQPVLYLPFSSFSYIPGPTHRPGCGAGAAAGARGSGGKLPLQSEGRGSEVAVKLVPFLFLSSNCLAPPSTGEGVQPVVQQETEAKICAKRLKTEPRESKKYRGGHEEGEMRKSDPLKLFITPETTHELCMCGSDPEQMLRIELKNSTTQVHAGQAQRARWNHRPCSPIPHGGCTALGASGRIEYFKSPWHGTKLLNTEGQEHLNQQALYTRWYRC